MSRAADLGKLLAELFFRENICSVVRGLLLLAHGPFSFSITPNPAYFYLLLMYSLNQYLQWQSSHKHVSFTYGSFFSKRILFCFARWPLCVTNERTSAPHTRTIFVPEDFFYYKNTDLFKNARNSCWLTGTPTTVLDMSALRVDPIRWLGLLSPNMRTLMCGPFSCTMTKSRNSIKRRWGWQPEGDPVIAHLLQHAGISHRLSSKDIRYFWKTV